MFFRGFFLLFLNLCNCLFIPVFIIIVGYAARMIPIRSVQHASKRFLQSCAITWTSITNAINAMGLRNKITVTGGTLTKDRHTHLLIANHRSWADILVLKYVFNRKVPMLTFLMKRPLIWTLPIIGFTMKALNYPFLYRPTLKDIRKNPTLKNIDARVIQAACAQFKVAPTTIAIFVEGSRFSSEKHLKQKSPFQHLLKPHAASIALILANLPQDITEIIDVTIHYDKKHFSMFDFLCGRVRVHVTYDCLPVTPDMIGDFTKDRQYRTHIQGWLNNRFAQKDAQLNTPFPNE